jgi:CheY-like chemotaxis protein
MPENLSKPKEILLVEDNEDDAEQLKRVLTQIGVSNPLRWLKDGAAAKSHLGSIQSQADAPAILLLDIKLPFFSGFEILRSIRGNPVFERTLRVVFSTIDDTATIKQAYVLGADSFLVKPVLVEDIREVITSFQGPWVLSESVASNDVV